MITPVANEEINDQKLVTSCDVIGDDLDGIIVCLVLKPGSKLVTEQVGTPLLLPDQDQVSSQFSSQDQVSDQV